MVEQTYDLTQMGAEVQAIINDANNVKGAGAQTTLTDESVLLKDTNGQYHKILKSSFTEAIRDTLAGLLVNNDKGTTINQIAAIASGDFGSVTPANLASVLGVFTFVGKGAYNDIPVKSGIYNISGGSTSVYPAQYGILAVFNSENRDARLLLFLSLSGWEITTSPKVYYSSARESGESLIMKPWVEV